MAGGDPQAVDPGHAPDERPAVGALRPGADTMGADPRRCDTRDVADPTGQHRGHERGGIRFAVEERRSEGARAAGRDQAEGLARGPARSGSVPSRVRSRSRPPRGHGSGGSRQRDADDHAPRRPDRPPRPARVDELRRPRPGRDDHLLGSQASPVGQLHPGHPARLRARGARPHRPGRPRRVASPRRRRRGSRPPARPDTRSPTGRRPRRRRVPARRPCASSGPRNVGNRPAWVSVRRAARRRATLGVVGDHQEAGRPRRAA